MEEFICPRCKQLFRCFPALSRKDNKTKLCSNCGTAEALQDWLNNEAKKKEGK